MNAGAVPMPADGHGLNAGRAMSWRERRRRRRWWRRKTRAERRARRGRVMTYCHRCVDLRWGVKLDQWRCSECKWALCNPFGEL